MHLDDTRIFENRVLLKAAVKAINYMCLPDCCLGLVANDKELAKKIVVSYKNLYYLLGGNVEHMGAAFDKAIDGKEFDVDKFEELYLFWDRIANR